MKMNCRKSWQKYLLCLAVLICGLAVMATGTAAGYVSQGQSYNVISTGLLTMDVTDETPFGDLWTDSGVNDIIPGGSVDRVVRIRNTGTVPFFCKLSVAGKVISAEGEELPFDVVSLNIDDTLWIKRGPYYYYYRILKPGETTEPFFTKMSFDPWMGSEYMGAKLDVSVLGQAVQSANNGTDPMEALGWAEVLNPVMEITEDADALQTGKEGE